MKTVGNFNITQLKKYNIIYISKRFNFIQIQRAKRTGYLLDLYFNEIFAIIFNICLLKFPQRHRILQFGTVKLNEWGKCNEKYLKKILLKINY